MEARLRKPIIFIVSGNLEGIPDIEKYISDTININNNVIDEKLIVNVKNKVEYKNEIIEKCDSTQSVITAALKLEDITEDDEYVLNVYNAILGGTPSSKLFQIFREKESLAYTARSRYYRYKDLQYTWNLVDKIYYTSKGEVTNSADVKEYYPVSPNNNYNLHSDKATAYKWYTVTNGTKEYYMANGAKAYSAVAPKGFPNKDVASELLEIELGNI